MATETITETTITWEELYEAIPPEPTRVEIKTCLVHRFPENLNITHEAIAKMREELGSRIAEATALAFGLPPSAFEQSPLDRRVSEMVEGWYERYGYPSAQCTPYRNWITRMWS